MDQGATDCRRHMKDLELLLAAMTICEKGPVTPRKISRGQLVKNPTQRFAQKMLSASPS